MNELVSVIIPTYNRSSFIIQALESVIKQTYKNIEIIVVDDGSIDNTKDLINTYINNNNLSYLYYYYKQNSGVANARNFGIEKSLGKYIAFLDSDDLWKENKLEKQINLFTKNDNLGLVHTSYTVILDEQLITKYPDNPKYYQGKVYEKMIQFNMVATSTVMLKKECIKKVGLFEQIYSPCEDYDLWIRVSEYYEFDYINESLAFYRESSNENISKNLKKLEEGAIKILDKNWNNVKDKHLLKLKSQTYSRFYSYLSTFYYEQNNIEKFVEYYKKAIKLSISNYISLPNSSKSISTLISHIKKDVNNEIISYTYLRLARQNLFEKKFILFIQTIFISAFYSFKIFYKFFIFGFLLSFLKKEL